MINKIIVFFFSIIIAFSLKIEACSTFLLEKEQKFLLAKSYDWIVEDGLIVVNKRQIAKQAMTLDHPMQWVSKYGSIIFTQAGRELPMGGMNETGLTIELMWLDDTIYPLPDSRSTIYELQWIQYQLDTASSVEEVLASDKILRIDRSSKSLIHFIILDNTGNSAIIEFINGKMVVYAQKEMLVPVLTNNTYQKSLEFLKEHHGFGGEKTALGGFASLDRFVRISSLLQKFSSNNDSADPASAFRILSSVANFEETSGEEASFENIEQLIRAKWNIVYDISNREIHFKTGSNQKMRTIRLKAFNFNGDTDVQVLDVQAQLAGDISLSFIPYSYELNRNLIDRYYNQVPFLKELSDETRELTARYPETTYNTQASITKANDNALSKSNIRIVVFDFGGVIAQANTTKMAEFLINSFNINKEELSCAIRDMQNFVSKGGSEKQFWEQYATSRRVMLPNNWFDQFATIIRESITEIPESLAIIKALQSQGYQTAMLSDVTQYQAEIIRKMGYYDLFNPVLLSYATGIKKPNPEAFKILLQKLELDACYVLFIDDRIENVQAANKLGIDSIQFTSPQKLNEELEKRGFDLSKVSKELQRHG